ncbi:hypothetical protein Taro_011893 [Colocasia esculenta]|uniref:Uncharacterized protein n=1 Tax=Colocasia esculenta TaxID=4460 RepID=A0A843UBE2_COLES|nr:hypothetical protein [Colocasia esculenta]
MKKTTESLKGAQKLSNEEALRNFEGVAPAFAPLLSYKEIGARNSKRAEGGVSPRSKSLLGCIIGGRSYQRDPIAASGHRPACSDKGPSFQAGLPARYLPPRTKRSGPSSPYDSYNGYATHAPRSSGALTAQLLNGRLNA